MTQEKVQEKDRKCSWELLLDFPMETTHICRNACVHTHTHTHKCIYIYRLGRVSMGYQQHLSDPWCGETPITSIHKILRLNSRLYPIHIHSVQSLCHVRLFVTPGIAARQASLSITNSRSSPKLMFIKSVMPPSHPIPFSSCPQSLPASESFPMSQLYTWGSQSIGVSASASVFPKNTQDWSPLEWTGWISLHMSL